MRMLGLIGGMSWESTRTYYQLINEGVRQRLGGLHSAELLLHSVDFAEIEPLQRDARWAAAGQRLAGIARGLQDAGATALVLCTNTMHKVAPAIEAAIDVPLLHIADPTAAAIKAAGLGAVGLLGTRFTMEDGFYRERLLARHGLDVLIPGADDRALVHRVIYDELCRGEVRASSRQAYRDAIARLVERGARGIVLGCTEIGLLIDGSDAAVPLFDTTALHAASAVDYAVQID